MTIADNIAQVRADIADAAARAGRIPDAITLVAVTKTVSVEHIAEAWQAGVRDFGENYVQESLGKIRDPRMERAANQDDPIRWHFIGHLQSNKARDIVGPFALVQSVDSLSLARELNRRAQQAGVVVDILLQFKIDPVETKFGIAPENASDAIAQILNLGNLRLCGLMGMAPFGEDPEIARLPFRTLHTIFKSLPEPNRQILSMGMSNDFRVAIEEGATLVRIGTAIFGSRPAR